MQPPFPPQMAIIGAAVGQAQPLSMMPTTAAATHTCALPQFSWRQRKSSLRIAEFSTETFKHAIVE
ncbi:hypothetical protein [Paenibacillus nasutitermitis]|uniref:hypothetical protein n=1 Tax=Paenibacillus nasutitermitis TaxID=1652958 RepID=UPI001E586D23|nr:hypothetical protein [Paenibacillus nasutitermitis]